MVLRAHFGEGLPERDLHMGALTIGDRLAAVNATPNRAGNLGAVSDTAELLRRVTGTNLGHAGVTYVGGSKAAAKHSSRVPRLRPVSTIMKFPRSEGLCVVVRPHTTAWEPPASRMDDWNR
jgi:hypothetical protein